MSPAETLALQRKRSTRFTKTFNHNRPHQALGNAYACICIFLPAAGNTRLHWITARTTNGTSYDMERKWDDSIEGQGDLHQRSLATATNRLGSEYE